MFLPARPLRRALIVALACTAASTPSAVRAAGAAYAVDTSEISDPGACKVETWTSLASNGDGLLALNPTCVLSLLRPVELSTQVVHGRADGEFATALVPKFKTKLLPSGIGVFGLALSGSASFDAATRQNTALAIAVPATMRFSETERINLNVGYLWDRTSDRHYFTYGAGLDFRTPDNVWTLTTEVFGQLGASDGGSLTRPRLQVGLRYRPVDAFSADLVYGRNISGENANWLTLAVVYRLPGEGKHRE